MFIEEEGGHQKTAGMICPMGLGVEEKGDRPQIGQGTVVAGPYTCVVLFSIKSLRKARNPSWMVVATLPCG